MKKGTVTLALVVTVLSMARAIVLAEEQGPAESGLMLVGVAEQGGIVYASLFDKTTGNHFLTSTRDSAGGYQLVSITDDHNAIVRYNGHSFLLRMGIYNDAKPVSDVSSQIVTQEQSVLQPPPDVSSIPKAPPGTKLPLVFQSGNLAETNLSDNQKAIITKLRGQFLVAISSPPASTATASANGPSSSGANVATSSGTYPSPASPSQTWISAQQYSDEIFRMLYGTQAFNAYEMGLTSKP